MSASGLEELVGEDALSHMHAHSMSCAQQRRAVFPVLEEAIFLLYLAEHAGIDLGQAAAAKMAVNAQKYPVEQARGSAAKYDRLPKAR